MIGIYRITSPSKKVYIGQSIDIEKRFKHYKRLYNCIRQRALYNSFIKYGVQNHLFEVIEECDINMLNERERYWQDFYEVLSEKGLNCKLTKTNDKSGRVSEEVRIKLRGKRILSDEQRNKMRLNLKQQQANDVDWFKKTGKGLLGIKRSLETRQKISISHKGKKSSEESRLKMSIAKRNMSIETKIKIGLASKGRKQSKETIQKRVSKFKGKSVRNKVTGELYVGVKVVSELFGYKYNTLANMLNGHRKNNSNFEYVK